MLKTKQNSRRVTTAGMLLAVGILLPFVTAHGLGIPGTVLLPMHLPVLLCGFLCGPLYGGLSGLVLPFLSSVLTGMPVLFPMAVIMAAELAAYGLVTGALYHRTRLGSWRYGVYPTLLAAMVCGRICYGLTFQALMLVAGELKAATVWVAITTGLPGILVQLLLIPPIVTALSGASGRRRRRAVTSAVNLIGEDRAACIVIQDGVIVRSETGRGVAPIIRLCESGFLRDADVVDKVVGKAAAMVMTHGGVRTCHAVTISRPALEWLERHQVRTEYDVCTEYIVNRTGDGMCPMEQTVKGLEDDKDIIVVLKEKLAELQKAKGEPA